MVRNENFSVATNIRGAAVKHVVRVALGVAVLTAGAAALVDTTPAGAIDPGLLNASPAATWQTNAPARAVTYGHGVVYVGGEFTAIRPPGDAPGVGEVATLHLAALDSATGAPVSGFAASVTSTGTIPATVYSLALSPDGATLYLGGRFTTVDGVARTDIAAVSASTGALLPWAPRLPVTSTVRDVVAAPSGTVYFGGQFGVVAGSGRKNAAAVSASGALLPWHPTFDGPVHALLPSPDGSEVVVGGAFGTADSVTVRALVAVDPTSGALDPAWGTGPPMSALFQVWHMTGDATQLYIGGVDYGGSQGHSEFDGTAALDWATGAVHWADYCVGDTHAVAVVGTVLYVGSHAHDCSSVPGGFPGLSTHQDLTAEDTATGHMLTWFPNDNASGNEATGPAASTSDGTQLFVVGDFTKVNGQWSQGIARFVPGGNGPPPTAPTPPTVQVNPDNTVTIEQQTSTSLDVGTLSYTLVRDGKTVVGTVSEASRFWDEPVVTMTDPTPPAGRHTYTVSVSDGVNVVTSRASNAAFVGSAPATTWAAAVPRTGPVLWWRLGEAPGSTGAKDSTFRTPGGLYQGGVTLGAPGAVAGDTNTAVTLDGATGYVTSRASTPGPQTFSAAIWLRTTTTRGGKLFGFGSQKTGPSGNYDRHLYMTDTGTLDFGVWNGYLHLAPSTASYNDGHWHLAVATIGPAGMALYVDGAVVGTNPTTTQAQQFIGYWRVGYDNLNGWPGAPTSFAFSGSLDEFAVYQYQMSASQVAQLYATATPAA
jgi:hypothetical protein